MSIAYRRLYDFFMSRRPSPRSAPSSRHADKGPHRSGNADRPPRSGKPASGYWIYGHHAVEAALNNPDRVILEFLATQEAGAAFSQSSRARPQTVDRERLDRLCERDAVHQGVCLRVEPLEPPTIHEALERPGPMLVLDQVTDPRNIGAILRSAAAFGACGLLVQDRNTPQESGAMAKAASGALDLVPIIREVNLSRALATLQSQDVWVVGLDAGGTRLDGASFGKRRVALVLGAEGAGLRRLTRETCDEISSVYMPGNMESLNVSNAAAVALYELARPTE
ncbi:23S rRNA (guanosine(2251)-2'-O)-methyltransferase RlmB [Gluconobacter thailandicus]|uniref:23S rRNA (guanosine(2251)-2'-O)-methyltransferase RlmB n=1 Tax=Gluconobacter thailandicus TaxID=257438 RepID=UPI001AD72AE0